MELRRLAGGGRRALRVTLAASLTLLLPCLSASSLPLDPGAGSHGCIRSLSIAEGLPDATVYAIAQDRFGFLWVGTEQGLCRYDGYSFAQYRSKPGQPHSLCHTDIATLLMTDDGTLWIGTWGGGLQSYDSVTDSFRAVVTDLPDDRIQCLFAEGDILWVGTFGGGLVRLDLATGAQRRMANEAGNPSSLSSNRVWSIARGPTGDLWVATEDGINVLDADGACVKVFRNIPDDPTTLSQNNVRTLFVDSQGRMWVGTWQGLNRFDATTGSFRRYLRDRGDDSSTLDTVNVIREGSSGRLWIGTSGGGLYSLDPDTGEVQDYSSEPEVSDSLSHNDVRALLIDHSEMLWIATRGGGLSVLDLKPQKFQHVFYQPDDPSGISDPHVLSMTMDAAGRLWVATSRGLDRQDTPDDSFVHFRHDANQPTSLPSNDVRLVQADSTGRVWAATWQGGLVRYDERLNGFVQYRHDPDDPSSLANDNVSALFEDTRARLWVGVVGGVDLLDQPGGQCTHFTLPPGPPDTMPGNFVWAIAEDHSGLLWIGTDSGGLYRLAPETGTFVSFARDPSDPTSLSSNRVLSLLVHSSGTLWIGTDYGLNRLDSRSHTFLRLDETNGLPNTHVAALVEDDLGHIWISTHHGLACLDLDSEAVRTYSIRDGVQGNTFLNGSALRAPNDSLYLGGTNGFNRFFPRAVQDNPHVPPVVVTAVRRFDEPLKLPRSPWATSEIRFDHRDSFFAFEFAALDFTSPADNRYSYRLSGFDRDWVTAGSRRYASYTNLDPGHYLFQVRGTNSDGLWNDDGASISVIIEPPFWRRWWFRVLLVGGVVIVVLGGHRMKIRSLERRERELSLRVAEALKSLRESEERYRLLFERNLAGVVLMRLDGELLDCNESFARLIGSNLERRCANHHAQSLFGGDAGFESFLAAVTSQSQVAGFESSGWRADGSPVTLLWNATLVAHEGASAETIESTVIDISERRKMEERMRQDHKLESLALMAGGVAHDFNNILMAILGNAELAQLHLPRSSPVFPRLQAIELATKKAAELSVQMLTYSGHSRVESTPVNLSNLVRKALIASCDAAPDTVEVALELADDLPVVNGDAEQLCKVFCSLFTNAWEAIGEESGQIVVRTRLTNHTQRELAQMESGGGSLAPGAYVTLQVEDSGAGMDEHTKSRVFDPFFTTKFTGRGLGLAAVLGIVRSHNGAIQVTSIPGHGTSVTVLLPPSPRPASGNEHQ